MDAKIDIDAEIPKEILDIAGTITPPKLDDGIPERVTRKELREALENYAATDKDWKEYCERKYLTVKEDAADRLYKLARAILLYNGFYTYQDAVVESLGDTNGPSPKPEDFE